MINYFHNPYFLGGHQQYRSACIGHEIFGLDTMLAITDVDAGQTESWSPVTLPTQGVLYATYSALSTGGVVSTSGLTYTVNTGYIGSDSFTVRVNDGTYSDTTKIYVTIVGPPAVGAITGVDSVCPGQVTVLADTPAGGTWGSVNTYKATATGAGIVVGVHPGIDTVYYSVTGLCGITTVTTLVKVSSDTLCPAVGTQIIGKVSEDLNIFPNPNEGSFTVNVTSGTNEDTHFTLTNLLGRKVREFSMATNSSMSINLDDQPAGIYYLSATNRNSKYLKKIVVQR